MNPSRGALLKPGQKGERHNSSSRSIAKGSRYEVLKEKIRGWWDDRLKIGEALREIQVDKLYQKEYPSFDDFCEEEFGLKRTQAYGLISAINVKDSIKPSAMADKITNERQARALAAVPVAQREAVITAVSEKGPVTAKAIETVARETKQKAEAKEIHFDKTGYAIPETIWADWRRADAFSENLRDLSRIKSVVSKGLDGGDVIFRELNNGAVSMLKNIYGELKCVIPFAICSTCQGHKPTSCVLCKGRGFLSEFAWNQFVPQKIKDIRQKAAKK